MAVFDNLKNFIRQGKQAGLKNQQSKARRSSADSGNHSSTTKSQSAIASHQNSAAIKHDLLPENDFSTPSIGSSSHAASEEPRSASTTASGKASGNFSSNSGEKEKNKNKRKYDNAVKQIIAEENESRSKMPVFPGLEQYRLIEKMGDGAFSIVYKAVEVATGEQRAVKIVSKHNITSGQRASVLKEAAIMRQLDHPSIVHMYAFLDTPEYYFIVLELVSGGELFHQIVHLTYFSEDLSRHVILQVAHAIRYLHEVAGVVHRDIKPENLLFTRAPYIPSKQQTYRPGDDESKEDEGEFTPGVGGGGVGTIKLADFGLSKIIWDSKTMTPCGTVGYTAPEIVKDEKYSKSVDMWALGCVLYTILCGFPPFYDESIEALTHKVAMGQYAFLSPWWDGISDSAKDLVGQLLTVDPEKRYTIDEFLNHPWITQSSEKPLTGNSEVRKHSGFSSSLPSTPMHEHGAAHDGVARGGALRDAFDVSNAVYRLEEEYNLRNNKTQHAVILEDDEDEEDTDYAHIEHAVDKLHMNQGLGQAAGVQSSDNHLNTNRASKTASGTQVLSQRAVAKRAAAAVANSGAANVNTLGGPSSFDLHLEGSTLLERRKARQTPVAH